MIDKLKESDSEVYNFLEASVGTDKIVALINLGVEFAWQPWAIEAVYKGLLEFQGDKNHTLRVIWALPEDGPQLPEGYNKENFLVKSWVMQAEILAHPSIKVAMIQCGFGGTLEVISAAKPVLCWPGSGEQHANAQLLEEANMG